MMALQGLCFRGLRFSCFLAVQRGSPCLFLRLLRPGSVKPICLLWSGFRQRWLPRLPSQKLPKLSPSSRVPGSGAFVLVILICRFPRVQGHGTSTAPCQVQPLRRSRIVSPFHPPRTTTRRLRGLLLPRRVLGLGFQPRRVSVFLPR